MVPLADFPDIRDRDALVFSSPSEQGCLFGLRGEADDDERISGAPAPLVLPRRFF